MVERDLKSICEKALFVCVVIFLGATIITWFDPQRYFISISQIALVGGIVSFVGACRYGR